jgi:hypothetical protein
MSHLCKQRWVHNGTTGNHQRFALGIFHETFHCLNGEKIAIGNNRNLKVTLKNRQEAIPMRRFPWSFVNFPKGINHGNCNQDMKYDRLQKDDLICTAIAQAPAISRAFIKCRVLGVSSSILILQLTGMFKFRRRVFTISTAVSGFVRRAAPIPP